MEETNGEVSVVMRAHLMGNSTQSSEDLVDDVTLTAEEKTGELRGATISNLANFDERPMIRCSSVCEDKIPKGPKEEVMMDDVFAEDTSIFDTRLSPIRPVVQKCVVDSNDDAELWIETQGKTYEELVSGISAICEPRGLANVFDGDLAKRTVIHGDIVSSTPDLALLKRDKFKTLFDVKNSEAFLAHGPLAITESSRSNYGSVVVGRPGRFKDIDVSRQTEATETDSCIHEEVSDEGCDVLGLDEFTTFVDSDNDDLSFLTVDELQSEDGDSLENNTLVDSVSNKLEHDHGKKRKPSEAFVLDLAYSSEVNEFLESETRKNDGTEFDSNVVKKQRTGGITINVTSESDDVFHEDVKAIVNKQIADMVKEVSEMNEKERLEALAELIQTESIGNLPIPEPVHCLELTSETVPVSKELYSVIGKDVVNSVKSELSEGFEPARSVNSSTTTSETCEVSPGGKDIHQEVENGQQVYIPLPSTPLPPLAFEKDTKGEVENGNNLDVSVRSIPLPPGSPLPPLAFEKDTKGEVENGYNLDVSLRSIPLPPGAKEQSARKDVEYLSHVDQTPISPKLPLSETGDVETKVDREEDESPADFQLPTEDKPADPQLVTNTNFSDSVIWVKPPNAVIDLTEDGEHISTSNSDFENIVIYSNHETSETVVRDENEQKPVPAAGYSNLSNTAQHEILGVSQKSTVKNVTFEKENSKISQFSVLPTTKCNPTLTCTKQKVISGKELPQKAPSSVVKPIDAEGKSTPKVEMPQPSLKRVHVVSQTRTSYVKKKSDLGKGLSSKVALCESRIPVKSTSQSNSALFGKCASAISKTHISKNQNKGEIKDAVGKCKGKMGIKITPVSGTSTKAKLTPEIAVERNSGSLTRTKCTAKGKSIIHVDKLLTSSTNATPTLSSEGKNDNVSKSRIPVRSSAFAKTSEKTQKVSEVVSSPAFAKTSEKTQKASEVVSSSAFAKTSEKTQKASEVVSSSASAKTSEKTQKASEVVSSSAYGKMSENTQKASEIGTKDSPRPYSAISSNVKRPCPPAEKVSPKLPHVSSVQEGTKAIATSKPTLTSDVITVKRSPELISEDRFIRSTETQYLSEDNVLIQQVKKRWGCNGIPSPETNLTCANYWRRNQQSGVQVRRNGLLEGYFRLTPLVEIMESKECASVKEVTGSKRKCVDDVVLDASNGYRWDGKRARYDQPIGTSPDQVSASIKQEIEKLEQNFRNQCRETFLKEDEEKTRLGIQHQLQMDKLACQQEEEMQALYACSYHFSDLYRQFMFLHQKHQYQLNELQESYYNNVSRVSDLTKNKISNQRKSYFEISEQLEQLMNKEKNKSPEYNKQDVNYKMVTLVKAPCRSNNQKRSWVKVCLPIDVGSAIIREDLIYDAFYLF